MNVVKIPKYFEKYDCEWFLNFIRTNKKSYFKVEKSEIDKIIDSVGEVENLKIIFFLIYQILITDEISAKTINPKPKNGIELFNPETSKKLGIYHIHLHGNKVFMWYISCSNKGFNLKFEYLTHPSRNDNYRNIIEIIYKRDDCGFNVDEGNFFKDLYKILKFKVNENILSYTEFLLYSNK